MLDDRTRADAIDTIVAYGFGNRLATHLVHDVLGRLVAIAAR